jgi:hypothetical protein
VVSASRPRHPVNPGLNTAGDQTDALYTESLRLRRGA